MADENGNEVIAANASFEDGMPWLLPTNVFDEPEACDLKKPQLAAYDQKHRHQPKRPHSRRSPPPAEEPLHHYSGLRSSQLRPQRTRNGTNSKWAVGGPGMQAVFLDSGRQRSCGTGVFLPRPAGTQFQSSNKPACPPVLLPSRVVQALNLNVHELGSQQHKPRQECGGKKSKGGGGDGNWLSAKRNNIDASRVGAGQWCSSEIFLPKEWTY